ncbi:MAG: hypothetical protein Q4B58_05215, partial [Bacteroidales bacterium]|nr:hypothetical protein [Bacteroidales bacterium]
ARVSAISDTWREDIDYAAYAQEVLSAPQRIVEQAKVRIPVSEKLVYTSPDQFQVAEARQSYERYVSYTDHANRLLEQITLLREEWHAASSARKPEIGKSIEQAEEQYRALTQQAIEARKRYCRLEQEYLGK